jgi:hypothetical protein
MMVMADGLRIGRVIAAISDFTTRDLDGLGNFVQAIGFDRRAVRQHN